MGLRRGGVSAAVHAPSAIDQLKRLLPQCLLPDHVRIGTQLLQALEERRRGGHPHIPADRWLAQAKASIELRARRAELARHVHYPAELPITAHREAIVAALRAHPVVIVAGETGSGKTTQLPKMCLEAGLGARARIGCTQPRRLAASSISRRLAEELGCDWGTGVGCKMRFNDQTRPETAVKVMTDGILLAEIQGDPLLTEYEAIIVDEAHERSLNIDFLLGYLRGLLERRGGDLKVLVTSATIDTERFAAAFGGAPVVEVSGRLFPVDLRYQPHDANAEEAGELTYVDAAVTAVEDIVTSSSDGDVLVFMPGERDIRETCDRLSGARLGLEVLPLFGRLSGGDQQRVFSPGGMRRVVVATNVAETSITVPRIRFVVDTGLARVSRYHPGTRSRRLPVEEVARSSADQRKGRCGRVRDGVCVRLFSEEDFEARPRFAQPEIQRCNLADVILRMKAFGLGEIETFPFLDPPSPAAIRGGYQLLEELGALDDEKRLTSLGRELARLPIDPAMGRMLLEARHEGALAEVLIIAAGLSIQDPRERPADQRDAAEAAHRKFHHAESDFLTLLNIWNTFHDTWESLQTQNQLRKFCRSHFLSYLRMREWVDLHDQLADAMHDLGAGTRGLEAKPDAIHRSVLVGLLGHVAERTERNTYRTAKDRQVFVFPGSGLFVKPGATKQGVPQARKDSSPSTRPLTQQPAWVVAGEIVETTRPYARTLARVDPEWIIELAPHVCKTTHDAPQWDPDGGRVVATERILLRGLVLRQRRVSFVQVNPAEATAIFIQRALVEGDVETRLPFLESNGRLREKIELWQTRLRQRVVPDLEVAFQAFYAARLHAVGSVPDLNRVMKAAGGWDFLRASPADILNEHAAAFEAGGLPDVVQLGTETVPVAYAYAPGEERDGVTLRLSVPLAEAIDPAALDWVVPALREERVAELLRLLPKATRRALMPLDATARAVVKDVPASAGGFLAAMSAYVSKHFGVAIGEKEWPVDALPAHLRPRIEVVGSQSQVLASGRDLPQLRSALVERVREGQKDAWASLVARWEREDLTAWDFGDLPPAIQVGEVSGFPVRGYPALVDEAGGGVALRLFRSAEEALEATRTGVPRLAERVLQRELVRLQKDLRSLDRCRQLYVTLGPVDELLEGGWINLRGHLFPRVDWQGLGRESFDAYLERAKGLIPGISQALGDRALAVLQKRHEALLCRKPLPRMRVAIDALVPPRFLEHVPYARLEHIPRYLQALLVRAERASVNPAKDMEKWRRVEPFIAAAAAMKAKATTAESTEAAQQFRWLLEEFKVSVFAQELGTAEPVSDRRLADLLVPR